jgi:hypothetical protein
MWVDCYPSQDTNDSEGGEIMKAICFVNDDEIICHYQRRFWQAFKMLTLEQREAMVKKIELEGEEE